MSEMYITSRPSFVLLFTGKGRTKISAPRKAAIRGPNQTNEQTTKVLLKFYLHRTLTQSLQMEKAFSQFFRIHASSFGAYFKACQKRSFPRGFCFFLKDQMNARSISVGGAACDTHSFSSSVFARQCDCTWSCGLSRHRNDPLRPRWLVHFLLSATTVVAVSKAVLGLA